jgi:hypothetical protein
VDEADRDGDAGAGHLRGVTAGDVEAPDHIERET